MRRKTYPSDLTNEQWTILEPLIPLPKPGGRPRSVDMREVVNAIFYILCALHGVPVAPRLAAKENGLPLLSALAQVVGCGM